MLDSTALSTIEQAINWLWDTLGRDFATTVATHPVDETRWRKATRRYFTRLYEQVGFVRVLGKMESQPLEGIYTDVNVLDKLSAEQRYSLDYMREHFVPRSDGAQKQVVRKDGLVVVHEHDKLFILGKPGAGKTTFMKWAALQAIQRKLDYFPIFINLKTLSDKRPGLNSAENILNYIARTPEVRRIPSPKTFIEYALESGKALVLFDGLDEVNLEDDLRSNMVDALNEFVAEYGDGKTLITCRVAATEYSFTPFEYVEMADFTPQQMGTFINNWFADDKDKAKRCHAELVDRSGNKALQELAQVPLLMTLLCLTFDELNAFPIKRSQIYDEATRALLSKWDASRNIRRDTIYRGLDLQEKKWMLAAVASHTFERGDYFVEEGEMTALLEDALRSIPNIENPDGEVVLKAIEAQHGILVERARRIHSFSHLTLQEYFTALNIVENARHKNYLPALMEHITDSRWREVFLLTAGMLRSAEDFFVLFQENIHQRLQKDTALTTLLYRCGQLNLEPAPYTLLNRHLFAFFIGIACELTLLLQTTTINQPFVKEIADHVDVSINIGRMITIRGFAVEAMGINSDIALAISFSSVRENAIEAAKVKVSNTITTIEDTGARILATFLGQLLGTIQSSNSVKDDALSALREQIRAYYQLDPNWSLGAHSFALLPQLMTTLKLFLDCLQVANIRDREKWEQVLLKRPYITSITPLIAPTTLSFTQIWQSNDLIRLRQWLNKETDAETQHSIKKRIRFLEEKQRIFYVELPLTLRGAFSVAEFRVLLRTRCGRALDDYSLANSFRVMVVDVIEAAEREGWLVELVEQAYVTNSSNRLLKETHHEMQAFLNEFEIDQL